MGDTSIEWADKTLNPVRARRRDTGKAGYHCEKVSEECDGCYAERGGMRNLPSWGTRLPYVRSSRGKVEMFLDFDVMREPFKWRHPKRVFLCSMTDLFGVFVPEDYIAEVWRMMSKTPQHTYMILTKRPERMRELSARLVATFGVLLNVWLGTSAGTQKWADRRIPELLQTPAAVRFISAEPLLGFVNICRWIHALDWVIIGGESGPGSREFRPHWARQIVGPCKAARVPVFVKQMGSNVVDRNDAGFDGNDGIGWPAHLMEENRIEDIDTGYQGAPVRVRLRDRKGGDPSEWPEDLRVREIPGVPR